MTREVFMEILRQELPPVFTRRTACKVMGGWMSEGTLANRSSAGTGPDCIRVGRKILYYRENFINWVEGQIQTPATNSNGGSYES